MADFETELQWLRDEFMRISAQVVRNQVLLESLCKTVERLMERQSARDQRVPVLLLGAISAGIAAIGVAVNIWFLKGP